MSIKKFNEMDLTYDQAFKLIHDYIKFCNNCEEQINKYVPNSHIAKVFREVLIHLELENMYPKEHHEEVDYIGQAYELGEVKEVITKIKTNHTILKKIPEYFNRKLLKENGIEEVERVYQKLREKKDYLRNVMMLIRIDLKDVIALHLVKRDLKSHRIRIK